MAIRLRTRHILLITAAVVGLLLALSAGPLWRALLVGGLVAYLLNPLANRLERLLAGRRTLAAALVYVLALVILLGLISVIGVFIWGQVPGWTEELSSALTELGRLLDRPFTILGFQVQPQVIISYLQRTASNAFANLPIGTGGFLGEIADNLIWTVVVLVSLFYFLRDGYQIPGAIVRLFPTHQQDDARELVSELDRVWRVFLRVQLIIFAILGVLVVASTSLIIYLFRQGWLPLSPFGLIILLVVVYAAIQQVDNLWLRPQYMGQALELHPGVALIALLAALALYGILIALIIIPLLASLVVIGRFTLNRLGLFEPAPAFGAEEPAPGEDAGPQSAAPPEESGILVEGESE